MHTQIDHSIPDIAKDAIKIIIHITFALLQSCNMTSYTLTAPYHIASLIRHTREALTYFIDSRTRNMTKSLVPH